MKKLLILFLSIVSIVSAQDRDPELLALIKDKLKSDNLTFEQFRHIGICRCIDTLMVQKSVRLGQWDRFYWPYYADLEGISIIPGIIRIDTISSVLDRFYSENLDATIRWLRQYNEKFSNRRSPYMICVTMYSNIQELRSRYISMIEDDNSYFRNGWSKTNIERLIRRIERVAQDSWD